MRLDRLPISALDRSGQLEAVLDRAAHQRLESFRRRSRRGHEPGRGLVQGDEVVGGNDRAGVVERPVAVLELERLYDVLAEATAK